VKISPHQMSDFQRDSLTTAIIAMDQTVQAFMGNRELMHAAVKSRQILFDIYNAQDWLIAADTTLGAA